MSRIFAIVEGQGDQEALPHLLRRLLGDWGIHVPVIEVHVAPRNQFPGVAAQPGAMFNGRMKAFWRWLGSADGAATLLLMLDVDRDDARELQTRVRQQAERLLGDSVSRVAVVVWTPEREYEHWILEGVVAEELRRRAPRGAQAPLPDGKDEVSRRLLKGAPYRETVHQPKFTTQIDFALLSRRSLSFRCGRIHLGLALRRAHE